MINTFDTIPLAFTYDWGMITDIGRRNISRMCAKLGVEHILISDDIRKKRANIKKNVLAWLSKPHIGMVPLFMAGDKHFFWHANKLKKEYSLNLDIWCFNPFEISTFKDDLSGIKMWDITKDYMTQTHEANTFKKIHKRFDNRDQHDSQEALLLILDTLHEELKNKDNQSIISNLFQGIST